MDKQDAVKHLATLVAAFNQALRKAEDFADEHELDFRISPEYGMGGWYDGAEGSWNPSSQSC